MPADLTPLERQRILQEIVLELLSRERPDLALDMAMQIEEDNELFEDDDDA